MGETKVAAEPFKDYLKISRVCCCDAYVKL